MNFNPKPNSQPEMTPDDKNYYAGEIKKLLLNQENQADLFNEVDARELEKYQTLMPEAYAQAVNEIKNPPTPEKEPHVLTMDVIKKNLKESGSDSKLAA